MTAPPLRAAVGMGANLGDRRANLARAVWALADLAPLVAMSSLYETAPVGVTGQDPYLNAVVVLDAPPPPRELLGGLLAIEQRAGRERRQRWGPRVLDLDLLLYGDLALDEDGLTVPHPRLTERRFVLAPLLEAWPGAALPGGVPLAPRLVGVAGQEIRVVAGPEWPLAGRR